MNVDIIREFIKYSLKYFAVSALFVRTVFEILRFEGWLVLLPARRLQGAKGLYIQ